MRRVLFILLLVSFLAVPAAGATVERTTGRVYLQFMDGSGVAKVRFRGNFFGSMKRGQIIATANVKVGGFGSKRRLASGLYRYRGPDRFHPRMSFRTPEPPSQWRLQLNGVDIDANGFVRGCMTLNGVDVGDPGEYRIGEESETHDWPRSAWTRQLGLGC